MCFIGKWADTFDCHFKKTSFTILNTSPSDDLYPQKQVATYMEVKIHGMMQQKL
jgi:hypothetical protein